jgi:hypothetical protein
MRSWISFNSKHFSRDRSYTVLFEYSVGFQTNPAIAWETFGFKDGLPYRLIFDVDSCIMVTVEATPTVRAVMPANVQLFGYFLTTIGAILC